MCSTTAQGVSRQTLCEERAPPSVVYSAKTTIRRAPPTTSIFLYCFPASGRTSFARAGQRPAGWPEATIFHLGLPAAGGSYCTVQYSFHLGIPAAGGSYCTVQYRSTGSPSNGEVCTCVFGYHTWHNAHRSRKTVLIKEKNHFGPSSTKIRLSTESLVDHAELCTSARKRTDRPFLTFWFESHPDKYIQIDVLIFPTLLHKPPPVSPRSAWWPLVCNPTAATGEPRLHRHCRSSPLSPPGPGWLAAGPPPSPPAPN